METSLFTVGTYLTTRLEQLGIDTIFTVPGDYTSDMLEIIDTRSNLNRIGNCNELNAAYAADGYARSRGVGAVCITTGVGAFSALNGIAGAYVEQIPVICIIGTLSNTKLQSEKNAGVLYHHQVNTTDFVKHAYEEVTVAFERIMNPNTAPAQIDAAIVACLTQSRPCAIEIMEDCYYMPCDAPVGNLVSAPSYTSYDNLLLLSQQTPPNIYASQILTAIQASANQACELIMKAKNPVIWIGKDCNVNMRNYLADAAVTYIQAPFVSSLLGKSALAENHPWYVGMYDGKFTSPRAQPYISNCDCLIGVGVWNTDLNTFGNPGFEIGNIAAIYAANDMVKIGEDMYMQVSLKHFIDALLAALQKNNYTPINQTPPQPPALPPIPPANTPMSYDAFFNTVDNYLTPQDLVVAEIGLSTFGGSSFLQINRMNGFLCQAIWASIGWSVPAALGASFTNQTRVMCIVGDGAFKLTCQEISTMVMHNKNIVIFVLNNNTYAVEQMLLNASPYKHGSTTPFEAANILQPWDYPSLMNAFSNRNAGGNAYSANVNTVQDLMNVFQQINQNQNACFLVNINIGERDYPAAWAWKVGN
jgi:indolepyruvate decarboxylase